jgi:type I restriction enzyme S subunit
VLVSNIRPYFRKIWYADRDGGCSNDVLVFRAKENVYPSFLYYLLSDDAFFDYATATAKGTKMPRGDKGAIMRYEVPDLPLDIQIGIADTLAALDARIAENRAINNHLEQMVQTIFKSWFVDFEPFGGVIPDDWREGVIADTCSSIFNGGTPRRNEPTFWEGTIPWLTSGEVRQAIIVKPDSCISEAGLKGSSAKWVPSLSTVVALYGATAGQVSMVATPLTTNQAITALVPKESCTYYNYLVMQNAVSQLENNAIGSAQQNISKAIVEKTACLIPADTVLAEFDKLVSPFFNDWIQNLFESSHLAALRDTLLPRLMSGDLSVADVDAK